MVPLARSSLLVFIHLPNLWLKGQKNRKSNYHLMPRKFSFLCGQSDLSSNKLLFYSQWRAESLQFISDSILCIGFILFCFVWTLENSTFKRHNSRLNSFQPLSIWHHLVILQTSLTQYSEMQLSQISVCFISWFTRELIIICTIQVFH